MQPIPHDWKQKAGITFVPGIDPEDMPKVKVKYNHEQE